MRFLFFASRRKPITRSAELQWNSQVVVVVRRARRKTMTIKVKPGAPLRVCTNLGTSDQEVLDFLTKNQAWVREHIQKANLYHDSRPQFNFVEDETFLFQGELKKLKFTEIKTTRCSVQIKENFLHLQTKDFSRHQVQKILTRFYRQEAQQVLLQRVSYWATELGHNPTKVRIKNMRSRWGSCTADGCVNLSLRLMGAPPWVQDYVVVHEICHLRYLNHSDAFWKMVDQAFAKRAEAEAWLKLNNRLLDFLEPI